MSDVGEEVFQYGDCVVEDFLSPVWFWEYLQGDRQRGIMYSCIKKGSPLRAPGGTRLGRGAGFRGEKEGMEVLERCSGLFLWKDQLAERRIFSMEMLLGKVL